MFFIFAIILYFWWKLNKCCLFSLFIFDVRVYCILCFHCGYWQSVCISCINNKCYLQANQLFIQRLHFVAIVQGIWRFWQIIFLNFNGDNIWYLIGLLAHKPVNALLFLLLIHIFLTPFLHEFVKFLGSCFCDFWMSLQFYKNSRRMELVYWCSVHSFNLK